MAVLFFGSGLNETKAQNLQFNSAVFYEYEGGQANGNSTSDIVLTAPLIVEGNQVLKITYAYSTVGGPANILFGQYVTINGKVSLPAVGEIYLPSGTYEVGFSDISGLTSEVKGVVSGILYDIVP